MDARTYWDSHVEATNGDPIIEHLSTNLLKKLILPFKDIADFGCGNGNPLIRFAQEYPDKNFWGYDFSQAMIDAANARKQGLSNVQFECADATAGYSPLRFDCILTRRLLININPQRLEGVVKNIRDSLRPNGRYIMTECLQYPLDTINKCRSHFNMPEIKTREVNHYLTGEDLRDSIIPYFNILDIIDNNSLYYFISRVFNSALDEPDYHSPMNMLAVSLTEAGLISLRGLAPEVTYIMAPK